MKTITRTILAAAVMTAFSGVMMARTSSAGGNNNDNQTQTTVSSQLKPVKKVSDKKRIPSRQTIMLTYSGGTVMIESDDMNSVYDLTFDNVTTGERETIWSVTTGEDVYVTLTPGQYEITAERNDGMTFVGAMEF